MCVFACVSHMHVSCQQQSGVSTLLHVEPQAVHRLELGDLGLLAAHGGSEEPFPQILKRRHSSEGGWGWGLARSRKPTREAAYGNKTGGGK